jgi:molybdopterin synthase catalytic subunit
VIDEIKKSVPIWKKERGPDGEEWVGWQRSS